jgi:SPP1 family predicted phage head-tail adaptor
MAISAGNLDRRICIEAATTVRDGTGQAVRTWVEIAQVWANVVEVAAAEVVSTAQVAPRAALKVTIRYLCGIASGTMRIVYQSRKYDITSAPREIGRRAYLEFDALSVTDGEQG